MKAELEREHEEVRRRKEGDNVRASDTDEASSSESVSTESLVAPETLDAPRKEGCSAEECAEECAEGKSAAPKVALVRSQCGRPPAPLTKPDCVLAPYLPEAPPRGRPVAAGPEAPLLRLSVPADEQSASCNKTEDVPPPVRCHGDIVMHERGPSEEASRLACCTALGGASCSVTCSTGTSTRNLRLPGHCSCGACDGLQCPGACDEVCGPEDGGSDYAALPQSNLPPEDTNISVFLRLAAHFA